MKLGRGGTGDEGRGLCGDEPGPRGLRGVRQAGDDQRGDLPDGQFDCAWETIRGKYNAQNIYNMSVEDIHYDIAEWAIAGNRLTNLGFALWYFNPFSPSCRPNFPSNVGEFVVRIGNHCFYNPTDAYADT